MVLQFVGPATLPPPTSPGAGTDLGAGELSAVRSVRTRVGIAINAAASWGTGPGGGRAGEVIVVEFGGLRRVVVVVESERGVERVVEDLVGVRQVGSMGIVGEAERGIKLEL